MSKCAELADRLEKWCAVFYSKTGPCRVCHGNVQCLRCEAAEALRELEAENERLQNDADDYTLCDCCESLTTDAVDAGGHMQCRSCTRVAELEAERDRLRAFSVAAFRKGFVYETLSPGETGIHPGALWTKLWRCCNGKWQSKTVCSGLFNDWHTYESQEAFFAALKGER